MKIFLLTVWFVVGVILSSNEGTLFPWINFLGAANLFFFYKVVKRETEQATEDN